MKRLLIIAIILNLSLSIKGQQIEHEIDQIFSEWNEGVQPGGVLTILQKDMVVFSKAYGKANIKYNIPNTEETIFNIGSVSKQFTAMGIVLLQLEGLLDFDDDIRIYLPELYDFDNKITIRHLLHHTSGFRSTPELFGLAGWRDGDAIGVEDNYRYFGKQRSLNFKPGSQFMYSNSGYILLAHIIEKVTNQNFNTWMKEKVFLPLEMYNTYVDEHNENLKPLVASPYNEFEEKLFTIGENTSKDRGASNIYSNTTDLSIWMKNFHKAKVGWEDAFELLKTTDLLNDGKTNNYAFGLFVDDFFGNQRIQHTGGIPGFLSYVAYYPHEELIIVLLTNLTSFEVHDKYVKLSQLFLENKSPKKEKLPNFKAIKLDIESSKRVVGDYWNVSENYPRRVYMENDTLWYLRANGMKSDLIQVGYNEYMIGGINALVKVSFRLGENKEMMVIDGEGPIQFFEEFDSTPLSISEKEKYLGSFYSHELETSYKISMNNNELFGYHSRHGSFPIQVLKRDLTDWSGFAICNYERNKHGEITGFYISLNRVWNVWFEKIAD